MAYRNRSLWMAGWLFLAAISRGPASAAETAHHYVFLNRDRERISDPSFLETKAFEGAQIKYTWKQLEPARGEYEFAEIRHDLKFLNSRGKRLFIQIQDASFDASIVPVPRYIRNDPQYHGGADPQYDIRNDDEAHATPAGWVARRWDGPVRERFQQLLVALGKEFDGKIEGINLPETAVDFGETGRLYPKGFTPRSYRDAVLDNLAVLKRAFPNSAAMQYANFMPEEKTDTGHAYLRSLYVKAAELKVGLGGPDLLPYKPGQMQNSYPLLREYAGRIPTGVAVQEGNYAHVNPRTGRRITVPELMTFATEYLGVRYIFWCTEEPYYSRDVIPALRAQDKASRQK